MANKFKKGFVTEFKHKRLQEQEENRIRKKHNITDNIVVVEKSNTFKFIIRVIVLLLKTAAWISLIILAAVGILCLIYPETRNELFQILNEIFDETNQLIHQ